jgi:hypothetical protein
MTVSILATDPPVAYLFFVSQALRAPCKPSHSPKPIMPDITIKRLDEMERYTGAFQKGQQFFLQARVSASQARHERHQDAPKLGALP